MGKSIENFFNKKEKESITNAIRNAEEQTTGEVRIRIESSVKDTDVFECARKDFEELGIKSITDLLKFKGIGEAKAISIVAALELGKRRQHTDAKEINKITCSKDIFKIMHPKIGDIDYEEFWLITLAKNNKIIQIKKS